MKKVVWSINELPSGFLIKKNGFGIGLVEAHVEFKEHRALLLELIEAANGVPEMKAYYGTKLILAEPAQNDKGADGYKVRYSGGYESWSPADVFEEAYQPMNALSFGHALRVLQDGKKVARAGWNGKGMWLELQVPDDHSKMTLSYIYICTAQGDRVPWFASQIDMLANDWHLIE